MTPNKFLVETDENELNAFYADFIDHSNEIDVAISHLIENPDDESVRQNMIATLETLRNKSMVAGLDPLTNSLDVIKIAANSGDCTKQHVTKITNLLFHLMDKTVAMLHEATENHAIELTTATEIQIVGALMAEITPESFEKNYQQTLIVLGIEKKHGDDVSEDLFGGVFLFSDDESDEEPAIDKPANQQQYKPKAKFGQVEVSREQLEQDTGIFESLSNIIDNRLYPDNPRTVFLMETALGMNAMRGNIVPFDQLLAAVYMHDLGMLLLPDQFFQKKTANKKSSSMLRRHPIEGANIVSRAKGWKDAVKIIKQHHERPDGQGYPMRLVDQQICDGAKILAIADAFCAMINPNHQQKEKRTFIRAAAEINRNSGKQFSAEWVSAFNAVIKLNITAKSHWLYPSSK
jgi:hypothetical protein